MAHVSCLHILVVSSGFSNSDQAYVLSGQSVLYAIINIAQRIVSCSFVTKTCISCTSPGAQVLQSNSIPKYIV
ncbi:hypothetical protein F4808DRAFT_421921 [Astrocystis sublimbata]|nr:hypothetical protein F4808DRAFT_421921 [Astrocystis sublimbata]